MKSRVAQIGPLNISSRFAIAEFGPTRHNAALPAVFGNQGDAKESGIYGIPQPPASP
jgi:hypothetical protein